MALLTVEEARTRIMRAVKPLTHEEVPLGDAIGRVAVLTVNAQRVLPPWDNSAMDGYALRVADAPATSLTVSQTIFAGDRPPPLVAGTAARIMTGAPLPEGADAVVMQERSSRDGDRVTFLDPVQRGQNVRYRGEDVKRGQPVIFVGREVTVADAGLLWSQGLTHLPVHRRPQVGIVSSGDELVDLGSTDDTRIIDSNAPVIEAMVRRAGGIPVRLGRAQDTLESMAAHFAKGLHLDVLITLAGVSVGEKDFTKQALEQLGVQVNFWKVAMRPGKPLAFGTKDRCVIFGLPGNPVSAMVTFDVYVRPALRVLQGLPAESPSSRARLESPLKGHPELRLFIRAMASLKEGARWATPVTSQSSGALTSAASANALIELAPGTGDLAAGAEISLFPISWGPA